MVEHIERLYAEVSEVTRSENQQSRTEWERILEGLAAEVDMFENLFRIMFRSINVSISFFFFCIIN